MEKKTQYVHSASRLARQKELTVGAEHVLFENGVYDHRVHVVSKLLLGSCCLLIIVVITIISVVEISIVVTGRGKTIPNGAVAKQIIVIKNRSVASVQVPNGAYVVKDQTLLQLHCPIEQETYDSTKAQLQEKQHYLNDALHTKELATVEGIPPDKAGDRLGAYWFERYNYYVSKYKQYMLELELNRQSSLGLTEEQKKLSTLKDIANKKYKIYKVLADKGYSSRISLLEKSSELVSLERDYSALDLKLRNIILDNRRIKNNFNNSKFQFLGEIAKSITTIREEIQILNESISIAAQNLKECDITSPVDGTIFWEDRLIKGERVETSQVLGSIIPQRSQYEIDIQLRNKDIAFVNVGQSTVIKFDALPFMRYGYFRGVVTSISPDAFRDENGFNYRIRVKLDSKEFMATQRNNLIKPGMLATVDIETGKRRIIEYFTRALEETFQNALKER